MGGTWSLPQTLSVTTCATSYGPRQLRTIPTTTRETRTTYTVTTRPLEYDVKYEYVPAATFIVTQPTIMTIIETAAEPTDATTSTRIIFDKSTSYHFDLQTETLSLPLGSVTSASPPYTVPTPSGFTPLALNPANAGADTLEIAKTSASVGTKSYSNINRVVCHVTTSVVHTRTSYWKVRHGSTSTSTLPDSQPLTTTLILEILSTLTEIPAAVATTVFEDSTRTLGTTEYVGRVAEYITESYTPTYWLPRSTVYAACNADNIVGGVQGAGIQHVSPGSGSERFFYEAVNADSARDCCEACIVEGEDEVCVGSMWSKGQCHLMFDRRCDPKADKVAFTTLRDIPAFGGLVLSNGLCGQQVKL